MPKNHLIRRPAIRVIGPSIAYIVLTKGQYSLVDAHNASLLEQWNWCAKWNVPTKTWYAKRQKMIDGKVFHIGIHNQVLPTEKGFTPDHINRDTLCNLESNLRPATHSMQMRNRRINPRNKSGFTGVIFYAGSWKAQIEVGTRENRKGIYIGQFKTIEEAVEARRQKEIEVYGH